MEMLGIILELAPLALFFVAYLVGDIFSATATLIIAMLGSVLLQKILRLPISKLQLFSLVAVVIFGGLTVILRDPSFIYFKPTLVYLSMAIGLVVASLLKFNPAKALFNRKLGLALDNKKLKMIVVQWVAALLLLSGINLLLIPPAVSESTWVAVKSFGFPLFSFLLFMVQMSLMLRKTRQQMTKAKQIELLLSTAWQDAQVKVIDVSSDHAGHAEAGEADQSHFEIKITTASFDNMSLTARHRKIYEAIGDLNELGIHALEIQASSLSETNKIQQNY